MVKEMNDRDNIPLNLSPNPIESIRLIISDLLISNYGKGSGKGYGLKKEEIMNSFNIPDKKFGDLSTQISFILAKKEKKNPVDISKDLVVLLSKNLNASYFNVEQAGPYINIRLTNRFYLDYLKKYFIGGYKYKTRKLKVLVEFPSVNPNKPWHVGHLRNALLGVAISNMYEYLGYDVERMDYIDDLGLQVAENVYSYININKPDNDKPGFKFDLWAGQEYVKVHKMFEEDEEVKEKVYETLRLLEKKDPHVWPMAEMFVDECIRAQYETGYKFNVFHDLMVYESDILSTVFDEGLEMLKTSKAIVYETTGDNKGCYVAKTPYGDKILIRSDGTATYTGKDVVFHLWKFGLLKHDFKYKEFDLQPNGAIVYRTCSPIINDSNCKKKSFGRADIVINVIGAQQDYPQKVVRFLIKHLGYEKQYDNYRHLNYELVRLPEASFSGRKGTWLGYTVDELYKEGYDREMDFIRDEDYSKIDKEIIADTLTVNAIKYSFLKVSPGHVITFDWDKALNMEGDSGPYLTYAYVRGINIINKLKEYERIDVGSVMNLLTNNSDYKFNEYEKGLLRYIIMFNDVVEKSVRELKPNILVEYLTHLVLEYNRFYENCPIINSQGDERIVRIAMVKLFIEIMSKGMGLLGMKLIEKM